MTIASTLQTSTLSAPTLASSNDYDDLTRQVISGLYAGMTNDELAQMLDSNFERFEDPQHRGFITVDYLGTIAMGKDGGRFNEADQVLALEFLKRDGFTAALDRDRKGVSDGKIDRHDISRYIYSPADRTADAHP